MRWWVLLLVACSKGDAPAPPPAPVTDPFAPEPIVAGERVMLPMEPPPTKLGELTFSKHPTAMTLPAEGKMGGHGDRTGYYFVVTRGTESEDLTLSTTKRGVRAEVVILGASITARTDSGPPFEVTLHSPIAPAPLTSEQCEEAVAAEATKRGLEVGRAIRSRLDQGVYEVKASSAWVGYCGTLTRRVWFTKA